MQIYISRWANGVIYHKNILICLCCPKINSPKQINKHNYLNIYYLFWLVWDKLINSPHQQHLLSIFNITILDLYTLIYIYIYNHWNLLQKWQSHFTWICSINFSWFFFYVWVFFFQNYLIIVFKITTFFVHLNKLFNMSRQLVGYFYNHFLTPIYK